MADEIRCAFLGRQERLEPWPTFKDALQVIDAQFQRQQQQQQQQQHQPTSRDRLSAPK